VFLKDMMEHGYDINRNVTFVDYQTDPDSQVVKVVCESNDTHEQIIFQTRYLVGCDGAHSNVGRKMGARQVGASSGGDIWAVIDGELETNFPDMHSKTIVHSKGSGSAVILPRERNMTRLYVQMPDECGEGSSLKDLSEEHILQRAAEIFEVTLKQQKSLIYFFCFHY
jgi:phenol 2-monooxygenase